MNNLLNKWVNSTLEDVATIIMGQSPLSKFYNREGKGLPFFQGKAEFGDFYPEVCKWCAQPKKVAEKDDILISVRAPVGPTNFAPSECCIGRGLAAIRPNGAIPSKYLLYYLRSIENEIESFGTGTTFKAISGKILKALSVPIAPLEQQKRIVAEIEKQFSRLDEAVANLKRVKANLKRYKAAVLKAAVEGKLTREWRKQHPDVEPASKLLERILSERRKKWKQAELAKMKARGKMPKNDMWKKKYKEPGPPDLVNLPNIPTGWVWVRLEAITEIKGGITKDSKRKAKSVETLPYLRVANVQRGFLDLDIIKEIDIPSDKVGSLLLEKGDILFNEGGDRDKLGRGWVWEGQIERCSYQNHVFRARLYLNDVSSKLISWFGNTFGQQYFMAKGKQTTNLASINKTMLSAFPIPLPALEEQIVMVAEIERKLTAVEFIEKEVSNDLLRAERLRQSILKQAFSGQLVPSDPADEPASVLLDSIRKTSPDRTRKKKTSCAGGKAIKKERIPQ